MKRFLLCLLLAAALLSVSLTGALADAPGPCSDWAELYLSDAESLYGIIPDSLRGADFRQAASRLEFAEMSYKTLAGLEAAPEQGASPFTDTDSAAVNALCAAGIIQGKGGGRFAPGDTLQRQEAATILNRMAVYLKLRRFPNHTAFTDYSQIADWANEGADAVCGMGLMVGMGDGSFSPESEMSREQAVITLVRLINSVPYLNNKEEIAPGLYCRFNMIWMWVEDETQNVIFFLPRYWGTYYYRPDYGYSGWEFFTHGGKTAVEAWGKAAPGEEAYHTALFDLETGEKTLDLPEKAGYFHGLTKDGEFLIMTVDVLGEEAGDWGATYYGVYSFDGEEVMPTSHGWEDLYDAGFVDTPNSYDYIWH